MAQIFLEKTALVAIIGGVAGAGKSTASKALAERLNWAFVSGDDIHPFLNVRKMLSGCPLNETDRLVWLERMQEVIRRSIRYNCPTVVECSALAERHRQILLSGLPPEKLKLFFLWIPFEAAFARVSMREGHMFKANLVQNHFDVVEIPTCKEKWEILDGTLPPADIVGIIQKHVTSDSKPLDPMLQNGSSSYYWRRPLIRRPGSANSSASIGHLRPNSGIRPA